MIKKCLICLCVFVLCLQITPVHGEELKLAPNASASLLMEASSRQVLYSNHEKERLWDEVFRLEYPHDYYVDLTKTLLDYKLKMLEKKNRELQ